VEEPAKEEPAQAGGAAADPAPGTAVCGLARSRWQACVRDLECGGVGA